MSSILDGIGEQPEKNISLLNPQPQLVSQRDIADSDSVRKLIFGNALDSARAIKPVSNSRYSLHLSDVDYEDPEHYSLAKQKEAILNGESLTRRLRGTWHLKDAAGNLLESKRSTLAQVPYITPRGTFILSGNEYVLAHQMRLRPGIYTRIKDNGEIESHGNVLPGKGFSHRYSLEPDSGVFKIDFQQSSVPVVSLLKAMGVTDPELRKAWGNELFASNSVKDDPRVIDKLYQRLVRKRNDQASHEDKAQAVVNALSKFEFDPEVNARTVGHPFSNINKDSILAVTKKLLAVSRGEADTDDRDHMAYQKLMGPEDLFQERLQRTAPILNTLLWKASTRGSLKTLPVNAFNKHLQGALIDSGLGMPLEEVNLMEVLDQQARATRLGTGGISGNDAVPMEARSVLPSQISYIDPVKAPECYDSETEVLTKYGWKPWPSVTEADEFACLIDTNIKYYKAEKLVVSDYDGDLICGENQYVSYAVTPNHRMYTCDNRGAMVIEFAEHQTQDYKFYSESRIDLGGEGKKSDFSHFIPMSLADRRIIHYSGKVYCATVPGGLLYVRRKTRTGFWCGNSGSVGVDSRLSSAVRKGSDGRIYAPYLDPKTGKTVYKSPQDITSLKVAFPNEMNSKEPLVAVMTPSGKVDYVPREEVDLVMPHTENWFSPLSNMVPFKHTIKGHRVSMGARFISQALPLTEGEAPAVRAKVPGSDNISFDELYGRHAGAVLAENQPGRVAAVDNDSVTIKYADGSTKTHELYNYLPNNRKTFTHNTALVQPGDPVQPGQVLAKSNFTDDKGHVALGKNLRTVYMSWGGKNYEDAWVISESAAKNKLRSEHMYQHALDFDDNLKKGKKSYVSIFPAKFDKETLKNIDDDGVIKIGAKVKSGDPLILAALQKDITHKSVHAGHKGSFADRTVTWDHHHEGVVTDVAKTPKGYVVAVKSVHETNVGDKLCYDSETEVLTESGWKNIAEITVLDKVATLTNGKEFSYVQPQAIHQFDHNGRMYRLKTSQVDLLVTDNHKLYVRLHDAGVYALYEASNLFGKRYSLKRNADWIGRAPVFVTLTCPANGKNQPTTTVPVQTYVTILGMFLSAGKCFANKKSGSCGLEIQQVKPDSREKLLHTLRKLNIKFTEFANGTKVRIHSIHWYKHLKNLESQGNKFIPQEIFTWSRDLQQLLYHWLMLGGGAESETGHCFTTTSRQLADDVQRLALHAGFSANNAKYNSASPGYRVTITEENNEPTINHEYHPTQEEQIEEWQDYTGLVHCVTMPYGHVIYVRRNGKPVWCGNSNRYGGKGVIAKIVKDEEMPRDPRTGQPFELIANPLGIISRCYDEETEFCTSLGWKFGRDVKNDDILLTFDPETNHTQWGKQKAPFHVADYQGDMIGYDADRVNFLVTPNHKMLSRVFLTDASWIKSTVAKLHAGNFWVPVAGTGATPGDECHYIVPGTNGSEPTAIAPRVFAALLGWYIKCGSLLYRGQHSNVHMVLIDCVDDGDFGQKADITRHLNALPFKWCYDKHNCQFVIDSLDLTRDLDLLGSTTTRRLPTWIFRQSPGVRREFLDVLCNGHKTDGFGCGNVISIPLSSERLADDVQLLWQLQGSSAVKCQDEVKTTWYCNVELDNTACFLSVKHWTIVPYNGKIYCPTVETGYVVTRRKGKTLVAGNTNPGQYYETALGRIAAKTGKPIAVEDFSNVEDMTSWVEDQLKQHGMGDIYEDVEDPITGRKTKVAHGVQYFMKLHHEAEHKGQGRGLGSYTAEGAPARGGEAGCFIGDQQIITATGLMNIQRICEDRLTVCVRTYDFSKNAWSFNQVVDWFTFEVAPSDLMVVELSNKQRLTVTKNHVVFRPDGSKTLIGDLRVGDSLTSWGSKCNHAVNDENCCLGLIPVKITSISKYETSESKVTVYDFTVEKTHNYCTAGVLVSNSKKLALMDVNALLSHNALDVLRDAKLIRGQKNQEYWSNFMSGFRPATPPIPIVYRKFIDQLRASGVNVQRKGSQLHIMALTDRDVSKLTENRELKNVETVDWKRGIEPVKGGLFDVTATGGHGGNKWSHISLFEPMPNPVMEEPIRRLLGLTVKQFESVLAGNEKLDGKTGPAAFEAALSKIDLSREITKCRQTIENGKKGARDEAIRKLKYLKGAEKNGIHPKDWLMTKVPVLPPAFRPVSVMTNGQQLISDSNYLYKEVWDANENLKKLTGKVDDLSEERLALYNAFKGVTGLGDPIQPKNQERRVRGMLAQVFGDSPKFGTVQSKLLGTTVDLVGRAVVVPNPDLSMDEVGIPENRAWEVYSPFVIRRLVRGGVSRTQALQYVKDRHKIARNALLQELDDRPVIVNRAPVLHRYGMMAFYPRLTKGDVLQVSPLIVAGMGMDFDGDMSNYQVPASDEARDEAVQKMLPSRNLIAVNNLKSPMYQPRQEYVGGLWEATASVGSKRARVFAKVKDAIQAYERGEMDPEDPVEILEDK